MEFTGERLIPDEQRNDDLYHEHLVRYMFAAQFAPGRTILDAGCGAGYGSVLLAHTGARRVLGVDVSEASIAYAREHYHHRNLEFALMDVLKMDVKPGSFDMMAAFEVIEHLDDQESFVAEARRVLADHGLLIISTPNTTTYPQGNPYHKRELSGREFSELLGAHFPALAIFHEDYDTAISLRPAAGGESGGWTFVAADDKPAREPDYYLALCAKRQPALNHALGLARSVMYELPADRLGQRIHDVVKLQDVLDDKNRYIARLEQESRELSAWATDIETELRAIKQRWYYRLFGPRA